MKKITKITLFLILVLSLGISVMACSGDSAKKNPVVESISLTTEQTEYYQRESFDKNSCEIIATYVGGSTRTLKSTDVEWNIPSFASAKADVEVSATYQGKSASIFIDVLENKPLGLQLVTDGQALQTEYELGEPLSVDGVKVFIKYEKKDLPSPVTYDLSSNAASANLAIVSGYDVDKPGKQTLDVTLKFTDTDGTKYDGAPGNKAPLTMLTPLEVTVKDGAVKKLNVGKASTTDYELGDDLDLSGATIQLAYGDDENERVGSPKSLKTLSESDDAEISAGVITVSDVFVDGDSLTISGYDALVLGKQDIDVSYLRDGSAAPLTAGFEVVVRQIDEFKLIDGTVNLLIEEGEKLDLSEAKIERIYNDATFKDKNPVLVDLTNTEAFAIDYDGFDNDNSQQGDYNIIITYKYKDVDYQVTISLRVRGVTGLSIESQPIMLEYTLGDTRYENELEVFGLQVVKVYSDGGRSDIIRVNSFTNDTFEFDLGGFDINVAGEYTITITLKGTAASTTFTVEVIDPALVS